VLKWIACLRNHSDCALHIRHILHINYSLLLHILYYRIDTFPTTDNMGRLQALARRNSHTDRASFSSHTGKSPSIGEPSTPSSHRPASPLHHHPMTHRPSISSRVSSLTRDSSLKSLDNALRMDLFQLTHVFGRQKEQQILQQAYSQLTQSLKQVVFVKGKAGTGKTALVLDWKDSVMGYFATARFSSNSVANNDTSVILQALEDLCESVAIGPQREQRKRALYQTFGEATMKEWQAWLPSLRHLIMGAASAIFDPDDSQGSSTRKETVPSQEMLDDFLPRFLKTISDPAHPVVLFLDDLQWADETSIRLIHSLLQDHQLHNFFFIAAHREEEALPEIPFSRDTPQYQVKTIQVENLMLQSVEDILVDLIGNTPGVSDLARIVLEKTHGNPHSIFQFLDMLQRKELLLFSFYTHRWIWDLEKIKSKTEVTPNVGHSLVENIPQKLTHDARRCLHLAAVIGYAFDPKILERMAIKLELLEGAYQAHLVQSMTDILQEAVSGGLIHPDQQDAVLASQLEYVDDDSSELRNAFYEEIIQSAMYEALMEGLIGKGTGRSRYKFSHDLVHKSFYDHVQGNLGIPREELHWRIGQILRSFYQAREEKEEGMLFAALDHLNKGSAYMEGDAARIDLMHLNQIASRSAKARSALFSAADFSKRAMELSVESDWNNHYDLLLQVYSDAAELSFACGRYDLSLRRCAEIQRNAKTLQDHFRANYVRIEALHMQQKFDDAVQACLGVLNQLGENMSDLPTKSQVKAEQKCVEKLLSDIAGDHLTCLPPMQDEIMKQRICYLSLLALVTYNGTDELLLPLAILRMMQNTIQHGACEYTAFAVAGYGMLCAKGGDTAKAARYGDLALSLIKQEKYGNSKPGTYLMIYSHLHHLRHPLRDGLEPLLQGYKAGIEQGEMQFASTCMVASAAIGFHCALPLKSYAEDLRNVCDQLKLLKQDLVLSLVVPYYQSAIRLSASRGRIAHDAMNVLKQSNIAESDKGLARHTHFLMSFISFYILNDIPASYQARKELHKKGGHKGMHFLNYLEVFFSGLLAFARYRQSKSWKAWRQARRSLKTMAKYVNDGMMNCNGMLLLLCAEYRSLRWKRRATKEYYDKAIQCFGGGGFVHFQAIASERAAEYMQNQGSSPDVVDAYVRQSTRFYSEWGAMAKVHQLMKTHQIPSTDAPKSGTLPSECEDSNRFTPIQGHIEEEQFISSELIPI